VANDVVITGQAMESVTASAGATSLASSFNDAALTFSLLARPSGSMG
jgi:hypothetical protein